MSSAPGLRAYSGELLYLNGYYFSSSITITTGQCRIYFMKNNYNHETLWPKIRATLVNIFHCFSVFVKQRQLINICLVRWNFRLTNYGTAKTCSFCLWVVICSMGFCLQGFSVWEISNSCLYMIIFLLGAFFLIFYVFPAWNTLKFLRISFPVTGCRKSLSLQII